MSSMTAIVLLMQKNVDVLPHSPAASAICLVKCLKQLLLSICDCNKAIKNLCKVMVN